MVQPEETLEKLPIDSSEPNVSLEEREERWYDCYPILSTRTTTLVIGSCVLLLAFGLGVGGYDAPTLKAPDTEDPLPPSDSYLGVYWDAAVVTNAPYCAVVGRNILMKHGNAVEAAIATLFCEGVVCPHSLGLGGGFLMMVYQRESGRTTAINARETAPAAADESFFCDNTNKKDGGHGKSVGIPGELKGYWEAFNQFQSGNVSWCDLIQPSIDLCRNGFNVNKYLAGILQESSEAIKKSPTLREVFVNPKTSNVWKAGDTLKRPRLAEILEVISAEGGDALYTGSLVEGFVKDVKELGGIITKQDMANYEVEFVEPIVTKFSDGFKHFGFPPPGGGLIVALVLNILEGFLNRVDEVTLQHRIMESLKYGYGKMPELGDPQFDDMAELIRNLTSKQYAELLREQIDDSKTCNDHEKYGAFSALPDTNGAAHISVLAPNGDAVAVTSSINHKFGSKLISRSTGFILNNVMDQFSSSLTPGGCGVQPSPTNFLKPGKRATSTMCPTIFVDRKGDVRLVLGGGGSNSTSAVVMVAVQNLWLNKTIKQAVDAPRFQQVLPNSLVYEYGVTRDIVAGLSDKGHNMTRCKCQNAVSAISRKCNMVYGCSDFRRYGSTSAGF